MFRIFPLSNQNAKTVAKSLVDRFITKCGCPSEIHTDQGKNIFHPNFMMLGREVTQPTDLILGTADFFQNMSVM